MHDQPDPNKKAPKRKNTEVELDRAIEQSFPASDPVAPKHITSTEPPGSEINRKPPDITPEAVKAAALPDGRPPVPATPVQKKAGAQPGASQVPCPHCEGTGYLSVDEQGTPTARPLRE